MEPIKSIIAHRLKVHRIDSSAHAAEICFYATTCLEKYFDPDFMQCLRVSSLQGSILFIGTSHSAVAEALRPYLKLILKDLQRHFGETRVTQIRTKYLTRF